LVLLACAPGTVLLLLLLIAKAGFILRSRSLSRG
jgi:hypothetical protein